MNKPGIAAVVLATFAAVGTSHAQPTRGFIQETGHVATPQTVYIDLYNSTGAMTRQAESQLRVGSRMGEILASVNYLGYKRQLGRSWAGYANVGTAGDRLYFAGGLAWTRPVPGGVVNINPEVTKTAAGNVIYANGAMFFPLRLSPALGRVAAGAELSIADSATVGTGIAVGLRWSPKPALTVDVVVAGDGGTQKGALGAPAALRVNIRL